MAFLPGDPQYVSNGNHFPGFFVYVGRPESWQANDFDWVEVMHFTRYSVGAHHNQQSEMPLVGQFWYYIAQGTGIWINVGKALRLHHAGYIPGCAYAVSKGYDTIINYPDNSEIPTSSGLSHYGGFIELVDCTATKRSSKALELLWEGPCPHVNASQLRTGSPHQGVSSICQCNQSKSYLNCLS